MYREHKITRKTEEPSEADELHQGFALIFGIAWAFLEHYILKQPENFQKPWTLPITGTKRYEKA
ncbi:hypothetical protein J23TS9_14670 [Paenibacillus sp. J23TS9]|uniref:hypothetical protein n=1 Tax=Paenibacillus sp. J23TS9 TaxID=2807193 RepID=UPI001B0D5BAF|nr:hypothetical protein [Paenibacillus sp. J23TS9]GIP26337.1 hypothetical protein J23TS9_14670 [Paenibacillus sp. J23TS9]